MDSTTTEGGGAVCGSSPGLDGWGTLPIPSSLIVINDESIECDPNKLLYALAKGTVEYEKFLEFGDPEFAWKPPQDEWQSIALGYTLGTASSPKGVVLHHRGAYLASTSNVVIWSLPDVVYLWTLPMFHGNGWCFTWTLAAICGTYLPTTSISSLYIGVYCLISNTSNKKN
ncbi:putative acid--thiol ligase [Helianthus anomalus]